MESFKNFEKWIMKFMSFFHFPVSKFYITTPLKKKKYTRDNHSSFCLRPLRKKVLYFCERVKKNIMKTNSSGNY